MFGSPFKRSTVRVTSPLAPATPTTWIRMVVVQPPPTARGRLTVWFAAAAITTVHWRTGV